MKNILTKLYDELKDNNPLALATIIRTKGSTPQVAGASAIFSFDGLVAGTLGGGILEADAQLRSAGALQDHESCIYDFELEADISSDEGAICGGSVTILIDTCRENTLKALEDYERSAGEHQPGVLLTFAGIRKHDKIDILRYWITASGLEVPDNQSLLMSFRNEIRQCLEERCSILLEDTEEMVFPDSERTMLFLQPFFPLSRLVIAGAGHIGQAVAHLGNLLDFEVTVIDDRTEYCNKTRLSDADHLIISDIEEAVRKDRVSDDTYYVIVTRGHQNDAGALKACIQTKAAYIGMIGSKTKISLMKKQFLSEGWATQEQLDRLHAPIGIDIGSVTVQEIAVSIAAQLVQVRTELNEARQQTDRKKNYTITALILAAGESSRMGRQKLLLPYGDSTILGTVITNARRSSADHVLVVLGSHREDIIEEISDEGIIIADNPDFARGMLSSVQAGVQKLPTGTGAIMILLGDQPMITQLTIEKLADAYRQTSMRIVVAVHDGKRGHPLIFDRKFMDEILQLPQEKSLHDFMDNHPGEILEVEADTPDILMDIDTIEDYNKALSYRR
jgi:xanthine dehydrogenase accessory factor